jgi:hypothetical protein
MSEEYNKLYQLLASLSSKTNQPVTPMISLMTGTVAPMTGTVAPMRTLAIEMPIQGSTTPPLRIGSPPRTASPIQPVPPADSAGLEEIMSKSSSHSGLFFTCEACSRTFPTSVSLRAHHKHFPMCVYWMTLPNKEDYPPVSMALHIRTDDLLLKSMATDESPLECRFCHVVFSNNGNLHKHLHTAVICNRLATARFKKIVADLN